MPEFVCKLGTSTGEVIERTFSGESEENLRTMLADQDYLVLSMRRKLGTALPFLSKSRKRVSSGDFLVFNQELIALIRAGLPILGSLDMLMERRKNPVFKQALGEIREQVSSGASLSEAFEAQGDLFPALYSTSLASGERSGEIATVLERYVKYSQSIASIRKRIVSASAYPAVLVTAMVVVIYLMIAYVFPNFEEFFDTMSADLPLVTVVLLGVSKWVSQNNLLLLLGLIGLIAGFLFLRSTDAGRRIIDRYKVQIPLVGSVFQKYSITRFSRTLGTLLAGGIPMVTALQTSAKVVGNSVYSEKLEEVARKVREGSPLWESLEETGFMGDMAIEMVRVGESTGSMTDMLDNVSEFYESEIESRIQTLLSMLEPVIILFMAIVVGALILAVYMPLLSSFSSAQI